MPNIGRTETEAMLAGVGRNHPNDHFLQIPRVDNVARCYVCELVPGLKNAMLDFTGVWINNLNHKDVIFLMCQCIQSPSY